jgi:hypothetical protein
MCIYLHKYSGSRRDTLPENPPKEEHVTAMGRPKLSPQDKRDSRVQTMFTMRERAELEARAEAVGLTLSEFIRRRTLGVPLPPQSADRQTRDKLATSLLRIGVNLNQITKHMNAGRHAPPDLPAIVATINTHLQILTADDAPR